MDPSERVLILLLDCRQQLLQKEENLSLFFI